MNSPRSLSRSATWLYAAIFSIFLVGLETINVARAQTGSIELGKYFPYYYRDTGNPKIDLVIVEPSHRLGVGASAIVRAFRFYVHALLEMRMDRSCNAVVGAGSFYRLHMSVESSEARIEQCVKQLLEIFGDRRIDHGAYATAVLPAGIVPRGSIQDETPVSLLSQVALVQIYGIESTIGRLVDFKPHYYSSIGPATLLSWWEDVARYGKVFVVSNRPGSSYETNARNLVAAYFQNRDYPIAIRDRPLLERRLNPIQMRSGRHAYLIALQTRATSYGDEVSVRSAMRPYCNREGAISSVFARRHIEVSDVKCSFESLDGDFGWLGILIVLPSDVRSDYAASLEEELIPDVVEKLSNAERIPAKPVTSYQVELEALVRGVPDWNKNEHDPAPRRDLFGGRYYIFSTARDLNR